MSTGRSRGRARTSTQPQPTPVAAPGEVAPSPTLRPTPPSAAPRTAIAPSDQTGRGRGTAPEQIAPGQISPVSRSSGESPPQQHSPPRASATSGRAALRGAYNQPGTAAVIGQLERMALQEGETAAPRENKIEQVYRTRPPERVDTVGKAGDPVRLYCNYFKIINKPDWVLYHYHVDYAPQIESRGMRIGLMKNHDALFPANKAFDGSTLYSLTRLHDEVTQVASRRETDGEIITITLKRVAEIAPKSPSFVHLFNLVFRRCLKLYGMKEIDRNYYDMTTKINIERYHLEMINGFSTSIALYEEHLLLNAEIIHKLLHKTTVYEVMMNMYNQSRNDNDFRAQCSAEILGRIVMTKYNDKTYRINDIAWEANPTNRFEQMRGGETSFVDYYQAHYSLKINDLQQPLLSILPSARDKRRGVTKPILLIPELCILTGVDEKMRMDFNFKKAVEQYSKVGPNDRCTRLSQFIGRFRSNEKVRGELERWQMDFDDRPAEIKGRVLPLETVLFGNNVMKKLNEKADWTNDLKGCALLKTVRLKDWIVIYPQSKRNTAIQFVNTFSQVIRTMEFPADGPQEISVPRDTAETLANAIKTHVKDTTQMVVVLMSSKRKDIYDAVKRMCCLEMPVPSQVVTTKILEDDRKHKSIVTKVAIQMNAKLGGEVWRVNIPLTDTMICGIDTYHDTGKKNRSVCAFIATFNQEKTRYFSRATIQESHQELAYNLTVTVKSACDHFYRVNGAYPKRIVIYRDGVSDGQLPLVMQSEIPQVQKAFTLIDPKYNPLLSYIIVKKRVNARFFADMNGRALDNPPCGTVIDTVVTRQEWFDFYLISQHVTQGTVNPTHYNIVYDTLNLAPDIYQKMTYKMTHMYYNWPGTIRVPATCQYAHKLAYLVGQSLHKEHHSSLCDKLFYL